MAGVFPGVVQGPKDVLLLGQQCSRLPSIPEVVPRGNDMDPKSEEGFRIFFRNSLAVGGILAVDDAEINAVFLKVLFQQLLDKLETGPADDVADKEDVQEIGQESGRSL